MTPFRLRDAARVLRGGGLVAYPTEAVYGIGCDPRSPPALAEVVALKGRAADKGLILIAAGWDQLRHFLGEMPPEVVARVQSSWPGFVTWVLPARPWLHDLLTGGTGTVAVRVTAHPEAAALCRAFGGPIVSTSANRSGRRPARSPLQVRRAFPVGLDRVLHGPVGGASRPSPIREGRTGRWLRR